MPSVTHSAASLAPYSVQYFLLRLLLFPMPMSTASGSKDGVAPRRNACMRSLVPRESQLPTFWKRGNATPSGLSHAGMCPVLTVQYSCCVVPCTVGPYCAVLLTFTGIA